MQFDAKMAQLKSALEARGYTVDKPNTKEGEVYTNATPSLKQGFIDEHFAKIDTAEAILVVNEDKNGVANYIGGNTLIEMAYAYKQGLDIFLLNPVPSMPYTDEIRAFSPIILNGQLEGIDAYGASLPLVYMSTENILKQTAVSRTLRRVGIPVRVAGKNVGSGVSEQPLTIDETYTGALNRHKNLKKLAVKADYYVTIESGFSPVHNKYSLFGCNVAVFEQAGQSPKVGIDFDIEFPREVFDKVPSVYPGLGIMAQKEWGAALKDPHSYLTNGRLPRQATLENVFYNLLINKGVKNERAHTATK